MRKRGDTPVFAFQNRISILMVDIFNFSFKFGMVVDKLFSFSFQMDTCSVNRNVLSLAVCQAFTKDGKSSVVDVLVDVMW